LHILSVSVFVEFVCLLVQLLLVTCLSSLFHLTLAVTPTITPPPLGSPSLSRGAVGQKKEKKKGKKESNPKKGTKQERIRKKRETAAQSKWETGTDSSLLKEFSVESGSVFATAYRTFSCYSPR
jgi:hypothetical protein